MPPKVSFIVPCYNLAHLLTECVDSILKQSYTDFEVLIMDDCSPDHTPDIAKSFSDHRIRYIRNEKNLGNVGNYNAGISLSRGSYVWLISADDRLRCNVVLERYVRLMDAHPEVGFVFCPAIALEHGRETEVMLNSSPFPQDMVLQGRVFLKRLLQGCCVSAPATMVRRKCYETVSMFPPHMPYAGDWYLWCAFAFHYDVAYFAKPMVNRRLHDRNMTKFFEGEGSRTHVANMLEVPWQMKYQAAAAGLEDLVLYCQEAICAEYVGQLSPNHRQTGRPGMTWGEFEVSLQSYATHKVEATAIRAKVLTGVGDSYYWENDPYQAYRHYLRSLQENPWSPLTYVKCALIGASSPGMYVRNVLGRLKRRKSILSFKQSRPS